MSNTELLEYYIQENKKLAEDNANLRLKLDKWKAYIARAITIGTIGIRDTVTDTYITVEDLNELF